MFSFNLTGESKMKKFRVYYTIDDKYIGIYPITEIGDIDQRLDPRFMIFEQCVEINGKEFFEGDILRTNNNFNLLPEFILTLDNGSFIPHDFVGNILDYYKAGTIHDK